MTTITKRNAKNVPLAVGMLRDFHNVAARIDKFLSLPNDGVKYVYWRNDSQLRALQSQLGISAGWINAVDNEGLLNDISVHQCTYDQTKGKLLILGTPVVDARFTWDNGLMPDYYHSLSVREGANGSDLLAGYLRAASASRHLREDYGLTEAAIIEAQQ